MNHVNRYLRNFKPYKLASHTIWSVSPEERRNILKLDWNESTIGPSPKVKERLLELVNQGDFFNLYLSTNNAKLYDLPSNIRHCRLKTFSISAVQIRFMSIYVNFSVALARASKWNASSRG